MLSIQKTLDRCIAQSTSMEKLLPLALARAAERRKISLTEEEIRNLTAALLNAEGEKIQIDINPPCAFGDNEKEIQATIQGLIDELRDSIKDVWENVTEAISQAVPNALSSVAEFIGDRISEQAIEHSLYLRKAHSERAEKVQRMWGKPIEQLDLLRHIVLEWNHTAVLHRKGAYSKPNTSFALSKLVARAYEVVGEIITLARAGYADGALARWRSLHEICVITMFLATRSDKCAQMYLSHHWVEELRLLDTDRASGTARATNAYNDRYIYDLRRQKDAMVAKFGAAFSKDFGWASVELGRAKTTFRDLESHVGLETLRRGYQEANSTVHGGALATLTRVSLGPGNVDGAVIPPAYGCEVAANYTTASLSMMIAELCLETEDADLLTMNIIIINSASKIRELIRQAQREASGDNPRARILLRKAAQRKLRRKPRRAI
ncbi:DUF5677 domain-containing protein [Ectopseudomonas mendocina]|uniref:DUF5677 domain-containing protein n=1 Tax=Ectopseudomonas mendocina TaxID=300 RepID=UPI0005A866BB|nr:DUF5677 domain-containing protein [Pseudomonas mendocina]